MRKKGHNLERLIAQKFKEINFKARTTRSSSKLLDDCGVDIVGTPFIIQCKAGYKRSRPKFEEEYGYIRRRLTEEFGNEHRIHNFPIIIIHQLDVEEKGRGHKRLPEQTYVMVALDDFLKIVPHDRDTLEIL